MESRPEHEVAYHELNHLLEKHAATVSAPEMLAIAANIVGKIIAMQDQRTMTAAQAMAIVQRNIELGNQQVMEALMRSQGSA